MAARKMRKGLAADQGLAEDRPGSRNAGRKEEGRAMTKAENLSSEYLDNETNIIILRLLLLELEGRWKSKSFQIVLISITILSATAALLLFNISEVNVAFLMLLIVSMIYLFYEEISTLISLGTSLKKAGILLGATREQMSRECANRWSEGGVNKETEAPTSQETVSNASSCPGVP